ncbi:ATP-binding protein [Collimonas sp.]|jgi:signal transduction histidine kinase|uniref:ATP-binding protein n=1 Tax=Collimonas sp. TaxID=1963772 RepID=UPI002C2CDDF9|nr:ATP-binding protein [Collimonas sp.]HWW05889.1 ATP-binding protein [Collimonas sp.]
MTDITNSFPIRVRSHILRLLGDQLVGHDRLAIFELVKNSYDADATHVDVLVDLKNRQIIVRDDGCGMTSEVVREKWLDIGTDSKRGEYRLRSPIYMRMPLGEKGVGRLAVQKLGSRLRMISRAKGCSEVVVEMAWNDLIDSSAYVDGSLQVDITERKQAVDFLDGKHGTIIEISDLSRKEWERKDLRDLKRLVVSLESPFKSNDSFRVSLEVPSREKDIDDVPDLKELLKRSIWTYDFEIAPEGFTWTYNFSPPRLKGLKAREECSLGWTKLEWCDEAVKEAKAHAASGDDVPLFVDTTAALKDIGSIKGRFHVFYRRDEILRLIGDPRQTKQWLRDQSGVRVFRDGIRVYNYGEPDDDWLALNARRINRPTAKIGSDQMVAAIDLDLAASTGLREKTNREGFNQDETYSRFRLLVLSAVEHFEKVHDTDRRAIDHALKGDDTQVGSTIKLKDAISGLKSVCENDKELSKTLSPYVKAIEKEVEQVQSVMLNAGMAGMGLALVFHEIDRSIRTLTSQAEQGIPLDRLRTGLNELRQMLDSISVLLRQSKARHLSIRELIKQILELNEARFRFHGITVSAPVLTGDSPDFFVTAPQHLLLSALNNIIDNAIYWAEYRYKLEKEPLHKPAILIMTGWSEEDGGILTVADNGTGFAISPADALQPFITKRTGGMGLGLYYCRLVMDNVGGKLQLGSVDEAREFFEIAKPFDGAAVTLFFSNSKDKT